MKSNWEYERDMLELLDVSKFKSVFQIKGQKELHEFFEDVDKKSKAKRGRGVFHRKDGSEVKSFKTAMKKAVSRLKEKWTKGQPSWEHTKKQYKLED